MAQKPFLFVCTGNTCRSPMAEYLMKELCSERGINAEAYSRGLFLPNRLKLAGKSHPHVSEEACIVMKELYPSTQIGRHIPRSISVDDVNAASVILAMEQEHRDKIIYDYRRICGDGLQRKVFALKQYAGFTENLDVDDPIGIVYPYRFRQVLVNGRYRFVEEIKPEALDNYRKCRDEIKACLEHILDNPEPDIDLLAKQNSGWEKLKKAFWEMFIDYRKAPDGS